MSPVQFLAVLIRLFALQVIVEVADGFLRGATGFSNYEGKGSLLGLAIYSAVMLLVSLKIFSSPSPFATFLLRNTSTTSTARPKPAQPEEWFAVGCKLLGLWLIADNLPRLAASLILPVAAYNYPENLTDLTSELFTGICGLLLLIGWPRINGISSSADKRDPKE